MWLSLDALFSMLLQAKPSGDRMKNLAAMLLAVLLVPCASALAGPLESSPLIGSWAVDVSRLPIPPQARPRSVTITFAATAGGTLTTHVDIVDGGGVESRAAGTSMLDGKPTPVTGSDEADISSAEMPVPNVLVLSLGKGGIPASTRVYAVAADGKTMIETVVYFWDRGQPVPPMRTNYFTRIR
jgi:hypothetical protein